MKVAIPYHNDNRHDPTGFKARARAHQSKFRQDSMKVDFIDLYGTKISIEDGHYGMHNFHPLAHSAVRARYPSRRQTLYCDVLRSEHIPFNLFTPLNDHKEVFASVLNEFMQNTIRSVDRLVIEYAPQPKATYLNDATSFDAYIEYTQVDNSKGIIGIEVKYTEGDYSIGTKEALAVNDPASLYWQVTAKSNLYKQDSLAKLSTDRFRQVWRNQLLGESIKQNHPDNWKHFTLAMVYPDRNTHIHSVAQEYSALLSNTSRLSFVPIPYKSFLQACSSAASDITLKEWVEWCKLRYLHD